MVPLSKVPIRDQIIFKSCFGKSCKQHPRGWNSATVSKNIYPFPYCPLTVSAPFGRMANLQRQSTIPLQNSKYPAPTAAGATKASMPNIEPIPLSKVLIRLVSTPLPYEKFDLSPLLEFDLDNGGTLLLNGMDFFRAAYGYSVELKRILTTYPYTIPPPIRKAYPICCCHPFPTGR